MNDELEPQGRHAAESARVWGRDKAASSGAEALAKVRTVAAAAPDESEGGRPRLALLAAAAAVAAVGGFGLVVAARGGSNDVIIPATSPSVESTATFAPNTSTTAPAVTTDSEEVTTSATPAKVASEPLEIEYPSLPPSITERWTTTIDGRYPQSAVLIDDVIAFGQSDLPGVRAVDSRTGKLLWSVDIGDDEAIIRSLVVINGRIIVNTIDAQSGSTATVLDSSGNVIRTIPDARAFPGAVLRFTTTKSGNQIERIGLGGEVVRSVDFGGSLPFGATQFEVRGDSGSTWYGFPSLEQIAGPLQVGLEADDLSSSSTATTKSVATLSDSTLRFFDVGGVELASLQLDAVGQLAAIAGDEPSVLVDATEQPDNGVPKPGDAVRAYRLVDGEIIELWAQAGRMAAVVDREGRTYAVITNLNNETGNESVVIDATTGDVVISGGFYETDEEVSNGFVFFASDDVAERQTVAYDLAGRELWRILRERLDGTEIVDHGVLVGNVDSVAQTVDLTFYD